VISTVHSSDNQRIGVERNASNLAAIGKLEDALSNLSSSAIHFVKEHHDGLSTSGKKPIGSVPSRRTLAADLSADSGRHTKKVTLSHLRNAAFNHRKAKLASDLVDNLALADTVATTNEDRLANVEDVGSDRKKGLEIDSHLVDYLDCWLLKKRREDSLSPFLLTGLGEAARTFLKVSSFSSLPRFREAGGVPTLTLST
jgi:hypothetical protein